MSGAPLDQVQALVDQSMLQVFPGGSRFSLVRAHVEAPIEPDVAQTSHALS